MTDLMLRLEGGTNEIIYWIGSPGGEKDKLPGTIFHASTDALFGIPADGIDISEFSPPGKDLIEKMYKTESLVLTIMNAKHEKLCTDERRHLYYNLLQYWYGIFNKYKPDIIISGIIPHAVHTYLIYELARLMNVKIITAEDTWASDRLLFFNDFWEGSNDLHEEFKKNKDKNFSINDLSTDLQEYYKKQTKIESGIVPVYMGTQKKQYSRFNFLLLRLKRLKNSILDFTVLAVIVRYIIKQFKPNLGKEYRSLQIKPDFNEKFIYFPLHIQPERTTSPQGDMFYDLILTIETLSVSLPSDWIIYVKEHPIQHLFRGSGFFSCRYRGYYKKIASLRNVKLVPIKTSSHLLIDKSQAVAVVTGTAGWEAVLRSRPSIIFGYSWYRDCSEIFKVNDINSCRDAFEQIKNGFKIDQQKIVNYLKAFDDATIHGYFDPGVEKISMLTKEENRNNIIEKILIEIRKIKEVNNY